MIPQNLRLISISLCILTSSIFALTAKDPNGDLVQEKANERTYQSLEQLVVGTYNVENLFSDFVKPREEGGNFPLLTWGTLPPTKKSQANVEGVAKAILDNQFDILVVEEVESLETLKKLNKYYLKNQYEAFLIEGNDERGIDVGYFVKKDLPFYVEEKSHKTETWQDPTKPNKKSILFSRDLPELHIKADAKSEPLLVLFGTHFKSKIDRDGDPESRILRKAQVERSVEIIHQVESTLGKSSGILFAGDFNGKVHAESEFDALKSTDLTDAFDVVSPALSETARITHTYHPKGEPTEKTQLDAVYVNKAMASAVQSASVYRYKDAKGKTLPIPNTYDERKRNPSDHFPVVVNLEFKKLTH